MIVVFISYSVIVGRSLVRPSEPPPPGPPSEPPPPMPVPAIASLMSSPAQNPTPAPVRSVERDGGDVAVDVVEDLWLAARHVAHDRLRSVPPVRSRGRVARTTL